MASPRTIDDIGIDLLQNIVSRLPAFSFASADCVSRSWNHACHLVLCRPKISSACSFNSSLQVAVEEVVNKVLSEPVRPQFAIASIGRCLCDLQEAFQLITAKLSSRVPLIINYSRGIIGSDVSSDEFKEIRWVDNARKGLMLTVGFVPGLKVKPVSLLKQIEDPQTFMIDQFITDIREFSTSISGCQSPAAIMIFSVRREGMIAVMDKLDYGMSTETVIVGDCGCLVVGECDCGIQPTAYNEHVVAVALVFVMDRNKPPDTGETRFHAVLSSGLSPVGPTYKVDSARQNPNRIVTNLTGLIEGPSETFEGVEFPDAYIIGVTKRRICSIGQEEAKWMTSLSFHEIIEEEGDGLLVLDDVGIKTGDTYRYYCEDSNTARSSKLLRSFKQRIASGLDNWEVCGSLIFTCEYRVQPNGDSSVFLKNFPGVTLGGTLCFKEIGRGYLTTQESQEQRSARASLHNDSAVYFIISYAP